MHCTFIKSTTESNWMEYEWMMNVDTCTVHDTFFYASLLSVVSYDTLLMVNKWMAFCLLSVTMCCVFIFDVDTLIIQLDKKVKRRIVACKKRMWLNIGNIRFYQSAKYLRTQFHPYLFELFRYLIPKSTHITRTS